jgi:hypothetical protein
MSSSNDLKSTLKSLADNLASGNKSAADVAGSLNLWLKEGGEALRVKIEDEVERSVSKMGFIKRGEFEALKQQVAELSATGPIRTKKSKAGRNPKKPGKKKVKSEAEKKAINKSSSQKSSKITKTKKVK